MRRVEMASGGILPMGEHIVMIGEREGELHAQEHMRCVPGYCCLHWDGFLFAGS